MIAMDEEQKKIDDPDYESPYDIDLGELTIWPVLFGCAVGLSPWILSYCVIAIERWIHAA